MAANVDHSDTKVLIIGVSNFPEDENIRPIPNVLTNVQLLKNCFSDPYLVGIPESNISLSIDEDKISILKRIRDTVDATNNKKSTIVIYYSGHGFLSSIEYKLFLATKNSTKRYLEEDAINIDDFNKLVRRSYAGRKIIILDCCYSGHIHNAQSDMSSQVQAEISKFEGTYVMSSSSDSEPSLYPLNYPEKPTYFTGKLIEVINDGVETEDEYCSLREIFTKIESDFRLEGKPVPQQSSFKNADALLFSKNAKFHSYQKLVEGWEKAKKTDSLESYNEFIKKYNNNNFALQAQKRIDEISETDTWENALINNSIDCYKEYIKKYPEGKYVDGAWEKLNNNPFHEEQIHSSKKIENDENVVIEDTIPNMVYANDNSLNIARVSSLTAPTKKEHIGASSLIIMPLLIIAIFAYFSIFKEKKSIDEAESNSGNTKDSMASIPVKQVIKDTVKAEPGSFIKDGFLIDSRDGKKYHIQKIGSQNWMTDNLVFDIAGTNTCYEKHSEDCETYGRVYDYPSAKIACPYGWHLPSNKEWVTLTKNLNGKYDDIWESFIFSEKNIFHQRFSGCIYMRYEGEKKEIYQPVTNHNYGHYWSGTQGDYYNQAYTAEFVDQSSRDRTARIIFNYSFQNSKFNCRCVQD